MVCPVRSRQTARLPLVRGAGETPGREQRTPGFAYEVLANDDVRVTHRGRPASTLRGSRAARFLADVEDDDPQELMARVRGNYQRGNERLAKDHPRDRGC